MFKVSKEKEGEKRSREEWEPSYIIVRDGSVTQPY